MVIESMVIKGWGQWPHLVETSASPITTWCIRWGIFPHLGKGSPAPS